MANIKAAQEVRKKRFRFKAQIKVGSGFKRFAAIEILQ